MSRGKPSEKRHQEEVSEDLNLAPIMNLIVILIPILLLSTAFVEVAVINVSSPQIGSGATSESKQEKDKPKLNLNVTITKTGFIVAGTGAVVAPEENAEGESSGPSIPKSGDEYNFDALTKKMAEIKDAFPDETKIIIGADADIPYDIVIKTMDATRQTADKRELFTDVVLHGGVG